MSLGGPDEGQGRSISRGLGSSTSSGVASTDTFACSFPPPGGRQKDTSTTLSADRVNDSSTRLSTHMVCDDEKDGDDQGASAACSSSATGPRQVSFHASSSSAMSGAGLTPSGSVGSYTGAVGVGCCGGMTDVTSSFLSMSPCSAPKISDAASGMSIPGWSPISVTSTSNRPTSATSSVRPTQFITPNWRDKNSNNNSNKRSGGSGSDGSSRDAAGAYGRLRSNRKKRSLHRCQPPSKCLSTLAAEVSILESDGDDDPYGGNDSDTDNSDGESFSFPGTTTNTTSTWDNHHDHAGSLSSGYYGYDDGRANSFNTRPYKRQPSSCEWDHHGSTPLALGESHQVSTSTRCSSGNVSGANTCTTDGGGSTSPCFSQASSNGEHSGATSTAMSPLLLSQSAPSGLVGEWGQFVDVISTDESNKKARPPRPLAFSPGLGGGSCIVGAAPSPSAAARAAADTSTNLPYFPKSRRRSSGGRAPPRRRASSVGSHHDSTIPVGAGTTGSPRRRFVLSPRSASRVVGKVRSSSLFLEDASVRSNKSGGGASPPPPSPSLGPLSLRQGAFPSGQDAVSEQSIMQRPSLDDVSFALDKMQV